MHSNATISSLVIVACLALGGCPAAAPVALNACPPPVKYSTEQESAILTALMNLPADNILQRAMDDYHAERKALEACQNN